MAQAQTITADVQVDVDPRQLMAMSEDEFSDVVDLHVRGTSIPHLLHQDVMVRYYSCLVRMKVKTEAIIASKRADVRGAGSPEAERIKFEKWRATALRFKTAIDDRIVEIKWQLPSSSVGQAQLEEAIRRHRSGIHPEDASDADHELWSVLDDVLTT